MKRNTSWAMIGVVGTLCALPLVQAADQTVATAVYARVGQDYQRERLKDGSYKPEFYALSNGGRIYGTANDITVERVTYPEIAEIATRLLAQQNYRYAQSREQAKLLLVLQWGSTIAPNGTNYSMSVNEAAAAFADLKAIVGPQGMGSMEMSRDGGPPPENSDPTAGDRFEAAMLKVLLQNRVRDQLNERNARVLGYLDDLSDTNDIRRWAGGGDRYTDLIGDVEESRYYIVVSAFDFPELEKRGTKKLLWQVRVSVRAPGNSFDDSVAAMLKSASKYFGQDSRRLIRGEESKGTVEMGDLNFLGEAREPAPATPSGPKQK